jgi:hypothetical protein
LSYCYYLLFCSSFTLSFSSFRSTPVSPTHSLTHTLTRKQETIRAFLDVGAFPNAKDASKRSPFELVLHSYDLKGDMSASMSEKDRTADFAMTSLPVLMELSRRGSRHVPGATAALRPSFQDALNTSVEVWRSTLQPRAGPMYTNFLHYQRNRFVCVCHYILIAKMISYTHAISLHSCYLSTLMLSYAINHNLTLFHATTCLT